MASQSYTPALVVALALCGCVRDRSASLIDAGSDGHRPEAVSPDVSGVPGAEADAGDTPPRSELTPETSSAPWDDVSSDDDPGSTDTGSDLDERTAEDATSVQPSRRLKEPEGLVHPGISFRGWVPFPFPMLPLPTLSLGIEGVYSPLEQELGVTGPFAGRTTIALQDVELILPDDVRVEVERLTGVLQAAPSDILNLDTPSALELHVREGVVSLDESAVARLLSLTLEESPWESTSWFDEDDTKGWDEVSARFVDGQLTLSAELPRGGRIDIEGYLEATAQGALRLVPLRLEREGRRAASLRDLFEDDEFEVPFRLGQRRSDDPAALFVDDEGLFFDINALCTVPQLYARVVDVRISDGQLRLMLEGAAPAMRLLPPPGDPGGYLWLRGGPVRFGRLFMERSDLLFEALGPQGRLSLSLEEYQRQLQAGQVLWRADLGLTLQVPAQEAQRELDEALLP